MRERDMVEFWRISMLRSVAPGSLVDGSQIGQWFAAGRCWSAVRWAWITSSWCKNKLVGIAR